MKKQKQKIDGIYCRICGKKSHLPLGKCLIKFLNNTTPEKWIKEFDNMFVDKPTDIDGNVAYEKLKNYPNHAIDIKDFIRQEITAVKKKIISEFTKGKRCFHCGKLKERGLSDWCGKCLEEA